MIPLVAACAYSAMLQWENTDQFGNLKVATSSARTLEALREDLASLVAGVNERVNEAEEVLFAIDLDYSEISAPSANQVSHVLNVPWLSERIAEGESHDTVFHEVAEQIRDLIGHLPNADVRGPWN